MQDSVKKYLSQIGRRGGLKSRRTLDSAAAREMSLIRDAKRAFKKFYSQCFWSYNPKSQITKNDILWVANELKKHGGRDAWKVGNRLCR